MIKIKGFFWKRHKYDLKTGYSTFTIKNEVDPNLPDFIYCSGKISRYVQMTPIVLTGDFANYISKDNQSFSIFNTHSAEININEKSSFVTFLSSGICPGIGPATAKKIWETAKGDIESFVTNENATEELTKIKGIDFEKALTVVNIIKSNKIKRMIFSFIEPHGGTYQMAEAIYRSYKSNGIKELKNNPYKVALNCDFQFIFADSIARNMNLSYIDENRTNSLIRIAINSATSFGNTYTDINMIVKFIRDIESQSAYEEEIPEGIIIKALVLHRSIKIEKKDNEICFFHKNLWFKELGIAKEMKRIEDSKIKLDYKEEYANKDKNELFELDIEQKKVISLLRYSGINLIKGKPGTGKTTIIKKIVSAYYKINPVGEVLLLAPTGRAAARIKESSGLPAKTIHKALDFIPYGENEETITFNENNQLEADVIIIDEFSMVDTDIFYALLKAIKNGALLLLVGDWNQLPSVGPGNLLYDISNSGLFPVYELNRIHRQGEDSLIIENSNRIIEGRCDLLQDETFRIFHYSTEQELKRKALELMKETYNVADAFNTQILTPSKKNIAGVFSLNEECQEFLNPYGKNTTNSFYYGNHEFIIGDKVIMLRNNYKDGYVNGDVGTIENFDLDGIYIKFTEDDPVYVTSKNLDDMMLAYAATIHKSQGSEYPKVILVFAKNPSIMLERSILYTGVTRAKQYVDILSQDDAVFDAIKTYRKKDRKTGLMDRLIYVFK